MQPIIASIRFLRDATCSLGVDRRRRARWLRRLQARAATYWDLPDNGVRVHLARYVRHGAGGRMLRAEATTGNRRLALRLKWCPTADPAAMAATWHNLTWWRARHPDISPRAGEILDYWADERVLVLKACPGQPLDPAAADAASVVPQIAGWLRRYAEGHSRYDADIHPRLLATVTRDPDGRLWCDTGPLINTRLDAARRGAEQLAGWGHRSARKWDERFDATSLAGAFAAPQPAGFVHGDFKPANVLVADGQFTIIDWWIAPCVSWPLTDVATFAGSLLLDGSAQARHIWSVFAHHYFPNRPDEHTFRMIELLSAAHCVAYAARRMRGSARRAFDAQRIARLLDRVRDPDWWIWESPAIARGHSVPATPFSEARG
jgi:Ser/Thr protein kinase RdoA (MazF antagonist)